MKKTCFLLLAILACSISNAQITISSSDMPVAGDTVRYSISSSVVSSTLLNQTGTNQTWDFSFLTPTNQDIAAFKTASSINITYLLTFGSSSYGKYDGDMTVGIVQANDVYTFYKNSSGSFAADGRGFSVSASPLPLTQTYTGKDVIYKFPLNYGNADTNSYSSSEANAIVAQVASSGRRINTVDGWGSITTPYGTFNCIRIKSVVRHTDTLKTQFVNLPVTKNFTEYKWLAAGQKIPVLEIVVTSGIGGSTVVRYRDVYRTSVFVNKARFTASRTKATVTDTVTFTDQSQVSPAAPNAWQWTITPNTFQYVGGTSASSQNPRVLFSDTGFYSVKLKATYAAGSDDTLRSNYIQIGSTPAVAFGVDKQVTTPSISVNFTDSSTNTPTAWLWSFSPNTISYIGGTSQTSQNPKVIFNDTGYYQVTLRATNAFGNKTLQKTSYIHVVSQLSPPPVAGFNADNLYPTLSSVVSFADSSSNNPTSWLWTFAPNTVSYVGSSSASQNPKVVFAATGFYSVTLKASNAFGFDEKIQTNYIRVIGTGINTIKEGFHFTVFPNPAKSQVIISWGGNGEIATGHLTDLTGKSIQTFTIPTQNNTYILPLSSLASGIYFIQLQTTEGTFTQKLIIE
jgi:PKD repeat protein